MKIKIKPITHWHPQQGPVSLTHAEVEIGHHRLGELPRGNIELQLVETPAPADPSTGSGQANKDKFRGIVSGHRELTQEQFDQWKPSDGLFFARCIVKNAGLTPAE
jgi:hypothetical protein